MKEQWLDDINSKLSDFRQPVPDELWRGIESGLVRRRRAVFALRAAACLIAAVLVCAVLFIMPGSDDSPLKLTLTADITPQKPSVRTDNTPAAPLHVVAREAKKTSEKPSIRRISEEKPDADVAKASKAVCPDSAASPSPDTASVRKEKYVLPQERTQDRYALVTTQKRKSGRFAVSVSASNVGAKTGGGNQGNMPMSGALSAGAPSIKPLTQIILRNEGNEIVSKSKHHQPLSAGVNVSFSLNDRMSITTGLLYSRLYSEFRTGTDDNRSQTDQTMHYLGIPVRLTYDIWSNDRFRFYGNGGATVEKAVKGRAVTKYFIDNSLISGETTSVSERRPQFSVTAGAGGEMTVISPLAIYAEPGLTYYIDNGSSVQNFYKDKKLNFTFQFGLRLKF